MKTLIASVFALAFALSPVARAADKKEAPAKAGAKPAAKGDPTGTWSWEMTNQNGEKMERKLTLKAEGDKLTGTAAGRNGDNPIEEGTFKNGEVAFKVTRERDGQKFVTAYKGKVEGDSIKGTITMNRDGNEQARPWEAKRAK